MRGRWVARPATVWHGGWLVMQRPVRVHEAWSRHVHTTSEPCAKQKQLKVIEQTQSGRIAVLAAAKCCMYCNNAHKERIETVKRELNIFWSTKWWTQNMWQVNQCMCVCLLVLLTIVAQIKMAYHRSGAWLFCICLFSLFAAFCCKHVDLHAATIFADG